MKEFKDLIFETRDGPYALSGKQAVILFDNGYGASIITSPSFYLSYEIAILKGDIDGYSICYNTSITNETLSFDNKNDITCIMKLIQEL
ncbi:MAG: hypothetical protein ACTSU6_04000 [Candidatus Njordarchaeales archaeon]